MMGCLQAGQSITRQSFIAIFFLYLRWAQFFPPAVRALYILGLSVSDRLSRSDGLPALVLYLMCGST